jgi:membrane protease YdiL (CAAX protease family)
MIHVKILFAAIFLVVYFIDAARIPAKFPIINRRPFNCFFCLAVAAWAWRWIARRSGGLPIPVLSHALADLGVLLAVWRLI